MYGYLDGTVLKRSDASLKTISGRRAVRHIGAIMSVPGPPRTYRECLLFGRNRGKSGP